MKMNEVDILSDIKRWLSDALTHGTVTTRGYSDQSGHPHTYAAVLIPDWQIKQKIAAIESAMESTGPYLVNHADAVDGSYCIARRMPDNPLYEEYWNVNGKWTGAGDVFKLHAPRPSVAGVQPPSVADEDSRTRLDEFDEAEAIREVQGYAASEGDSNA